MKLQSFILVWLEEKDSQVTPNWVFSHDVTATILVSQNVETQTAAMLVSQTNPVGGELLHGCCKSVAVLESL